MKVILIQDVKTLGKAGSVVEVKTGYGLNYLFPEGLAVLATKEALRDTERMIKEEKTREAEEKAELEALKTLVETKTIILPVQAKDGKLFGSIGKKEIAEALAKEGASIDTRFLILPKPLKTLGEHVVALQFGLGIKGKVKVTLVAE